MRKMKAKMVAIGLRQNHVARALNMDATRLCRILNDWVNPTAEEKEQIKAYVAAHSAAAGSQRSGT
jgi:hypothetical protein